MLASASSSDLLPRSSRSLTDEKKAVHRATTQNPMMASAVWAAGGAAISWTPRKEPIRPDRERVGIRMNRKLSHRAMRIPARSLTRRVTAMSCTENSTTSWLRGPPPGW